MRTLPGRLFRTTFLSLALIFLLQGPAHAQEEEPISGPPAEGDAAVADTTPEPVTLPAVEVLLDRIRMVGSGERRDAIPGSAHYLSREELEARPLVHDDIHRILRQVPGVNVQEEEGYGLRPNIGMRGTGVERSSKITIMEDGVLIAPAPYAAPSAYYFPIAGRMEAIEVRKGSSQIEYGPRTIGGALNLVSTPIPRAMTATAEAEAGERGGRKIQARAGNSYGNFGWLAETYQLETDGFKQLEGDEQTGFDVGDYLVKLRVNTDPEAETYQELEVKAGLTDELSNETYLGLTDGDFARDPFRRYPASRNDLMDADHQQIGARHFLRAPGGLDLTTTLYHNEFARNWYKLDNVRGVGISRVLDQPAEHAGELSILRGEESEPDALVLRANNREYYSRGVQSVLGLRLDGERLSQEIELGVRYHRDEEDRLQFEDGYRMLNGSLIPTSHGAPGSQSNRVSGAGAWALHALDRISVGDWTFTPGLRYENIRFTRTEYATDDPERSQPAGEREHRVDALIPGLGVSRRLTPSLSLFAGLHRGFGPPGPGAEEETRPEESVNYELGTRYRRDGFRIQAVGFYNDYDNILGRATLAAGESGAGDLFNGGAARILGMELDLEYDPASDRASLGIPLRLAYTFTQAEFRTDFESDFGPWGEVRAGDRLPYLPVHQAHAGVGLEMPDWRANLTSQYVSAMRARAGQGDIPPGAGTDAFLVFNLSADYRLTSWSTLTAGVQNLTDETYVVARRPAGARPGLPRTFTAGISFGR